MGKKKRKLPAWLHSPASAVLRSAMGLPLIFGFDDAHAGARPLARAYASLQPKRTRRAEEHLSYAFPEMSAEERHAIAMHGWEHLFTLALEFAFAPRLLNTETWPRYIDIGNIGSGVSHLLGSRPVISITGHCGNWEVLGYTIGLLGFRLHALYRPLDLKPLDAWVRRTRESRGLVLVDKFGSLQRLPGILKPRDGSPGAPLGFVADQNAGDRGMFVPFFGRLASTYKSIGLLAMHHDAVILCGAARRLRSDAPHPPKVLIGPQQRPILDPPDELRSMGAFRYQIDLADIIMPEEWKVQPDPLFYITARYRRAIETMVRAAPEQYLWMHRIWKSRPRHERLGKPFPPALRDKLQALPWMTPAELDRIMENSARDAAAIAAENGASGRPQTEEAGEEAAMQEAGLT